MFNKAVNELLNLDHPSEPNRPRQCEWRKKEYYLCKLSYKMLTICNIRK